MWEVKVECGMWKCGVRDDVDDVRGCLTPSFPPSPLVIPITRYACHSSVADTCVATTGGATTGGGAAGVVSIKMYDVTGMVTLNGPTPDMFTNVMKDGFKEVVADAAGVTADKVGSVGSLGGV